MKILATAVAVFVSFFATMASAEQVTLCDQRVDYVPTGIPSPEINGVWVGTIEYGVRYKECRAFVIEGLNKDGWIVGKQAWQQAFNNNSDAKSYLYMGHDRIGLKKQKDGTYNSGKKWTFTLRLEGNQLLGKFHNENDGGNYDVVLERR